MTAPDAAAPQPAPRGLKRKTKAIIGLVLFAPFLLFGLYTLLALTWNYSSGYRAGTLMKFSRKGFVCKTWEGEIQQAVVPGVAPVIWQFTVRDDSVAQRLSGMLGSKVSLHYREHLGVPTSCFGDTGYYVDSVAVVNGN